MDLKIDKKNLERPKILLGITLADVGGAQIHVLEIIKQLCQKFNFSMAVKSQGFLVYECDLYVSQVFFIKKLVNTINPLADLLAIFEFITVIKRELPVLVHLHSSKAGIVGRLSSFFCNVPTVFTAHGWAFTEGAPVLNRVLAIPVEKLMAKITKRIICVSDYDRRLALKYKIAHSSQLITIYNGIIDHSARANLNCGDSEIVIIMVARFSPPKDFFTMLIVLQDLFNCRMKFVGDGALLPQVKKFAESLDLLDRVDFMGERLDVPDLLASSHIFALISHYEAFPISILEAMRAGLPVVASNAGGISEAVIDGQTGFLVNKGDISALRDSFSQLINDPMLRQKFGAAGRKSYEESFTADIMAQKTGKIYSEVLNLKNDNH